MLTLYQVAWLIIQFQKLGSPVIRDDCEQKLSAGLPKKVIHKRGGRLWITLAGYASQQSWP